jgi:HEAT repeat protein
MTEKSVNGIIGVQIKANTNILKDIGVGGHKIAIKALEKIGTKEAIEPIIGVLENKNEDVKVRVAAAFALWKTSIRDVQVTKSLIKVLKDESDHRLVRWSATHALGEFGDVTAIEPLIEALKDKHADVRAGAAEALGKMGDERSLKPLIKALNDDIWWVREAAAEALGKLAQRGIKDEDAVPPLREMMESPFVRIYAAARDALQQMGYSTDVTKTSGASGIGDKVVVPATKSFLKGRNDVPPVGNILCLPKGRVGKPTRLFLRNR